MSRREFDRKTKVLPLYKRGRSLAETLDAYSVPEPNSGCWIWLGAANKRWHGSLGYQGKIIGSHRASWLVHRGKIPDGFFVCHRCDVPLCINPDHLFLGQAVDNVRDMLSKGRGTKARGLSHGQNKLSEDDVRSIRSSCLSHRRIASSYGISCGTVSGIRRRKIWAWLNDEPAQ